MSLPLHVEKDEASLSQDVAPERTTRVLWTALGSSVLMLIGVSACALHPFGSHASAESARLVPQVAFSPLPLLGPGGVQAARHGHGPARPRAFRPSVLPGSRAASFDVVKQPWKSNLNLGTPDAPMEGEVTASSIMDAWSASQQISLGSTVYRKVIRKVDDVFQNWLSYESPQERWLGQDREGALQAMERLRHKKKITQKEISTVEGQAEKNAQLQQWKDALDATGMPDGRAVGLKEIEDALELIHSVDTPAGDDESGPEQHILGLAYGSSAPENAVAVAQVEVTFKRDDNLVLTKTALKQMLLGPVTDAVHVVEQEGDNGAIESIKRYVEVVFVTDLVAKPTPTQHEAAAELLKAIVDWAKLEGRLVAVHPYNEEMYDYYKTIGFTDIDEELGPDLVWTGDHDSAKTPLHWSTLGIDAGKEDPAKQPLLLDFLGKPQLLSVS